ncbi:MAG TPA: carbonic anhydrase, partial [Candidatus Nitrosotalea sp.]|nr:carbonic anhydrase [Candidatus Nitrosotalea sp.]
LEANRAVAPGGSKAGLDATGFADSLPLVALTCIDPRLNRLIPEAFCVPADKFIWLRNAGNIIFDPMSSMMRTLALGCAIKGGREIAVIGHTDCLVGKATAAQIMDRFRDLGVVRSRLPENLNEFFGLFASERQNVIRGADIIRQSPLIGPRVPVHGLLLDIQTGKLEWVVNGYQTLETTAHSVASTVVEPAPGNMDVLSAPLAKFDFGEMNTQESRIGETTVDANQWLSRLTTLGSGATEAAPVQASQGTPSEFEGKFDRASQYKVIGSDEKVYGPISGLKVLEWMADGRIGWETASQMEGSTEWRPLRAWGDGPRVPLPPAIKPDPRLQKARKR